MAFVQEVNQLTGNLPLREISERLYIQVARVVAEDDARPRPRRRVPRLPPEMAEVLAAAEIGDWDAIGHIRRAHISMSFTRMLQNARARAPDPRKPVPNPDPRFTADEYAARLAKTRAAMEAQGIDLLIVTDPSNMHWLTGYDGWSFYVHQARASCRPTASRSGTAAARTPTAPSAPPISPDDNIVGYPDHYVQSTERHPMDYPRRRSSPSAAGTGSRIGVEMDNYWFSAAAFAALQQHLPNARFADATGLVNWQRAVKSPTEIDYMRKAAPHRRGDARRASSRRSSPACASATSSPRSIDAGIRGVDGFGGDYPAIVPLLPSGADASAPHLTWDDKPMQAGRRHLLRDRRLLPPLPLPAVAHRLPRQADAGIPRRREGDARRHGGGPRRRQARQHLRGHRQRLLRRAQASYGIVKDNRTGYPIGLSYPPDWGERTMSLRPGDRTELKPGMTFHFMTGLWLETMGLEITESDPHHRDRRRMPRQRAAPALREATERMTPTCAPSPITPTVDLDADGVQHGFLRLPYSRDDSAWGSVMIPIAVIRERRRARRRSSPAATTATSTRARSRSSTSPARLDPAERHRPRHHRAGHELPGLPRRHPHLADRPRQPQPQLSRAGPTAR